MAGKILALGVKDMTLKELTHLTEEIPPKTISVVSARVDPFFRYSLLEVRVYRMGKNVRHQAYSTTMNVFACCRNSALRQYAEKHKMQIMAHGLLGGHYVRHGMQNPSYTSHKALYGAFSCSSTVSE